MPERWLWKISSEYRDVSSRETWCHGTSNHGETISNTTPNTTVPSLYLMLLHMFPSLRVVPFLKEIEDLLIGANIQVRNVQAIITRTDSKRETVGGRKHLTAYELSTSFIRRLTQN